MEDHAQEDERDRRPSRMHVARAVEPRRREREHRVAQEDAARREEPDEPAREPLDVDAREDRDDEVEDLEPASERKRQYCREGARGTWETRRSRARRPLKGGKVRRPRR
mgnify:CR=1 FL=1